jgi:selenobiotic family peptide radical SAM maturase
VSLEGLAAYDDEIRGPGHFAATLGFLALLRRAGVHRHVMLTLHRENLGQVMLLTEALRGHTDCFTFNRLVPTGRGAALQLPTRDEYVAFLKTYIVGSRTNPTLRFKDNLFNIFRYHYGRPLTGGCTGFGCGAAFNFVAVLPDGQVHACRKFPSPIGDLTRSTFAEVYDSEGARAYRRRSRACRWCRIRAGCGGCLAVTHGLGQPALEARDPHCFVDDRHRLLAPF